MYGGVYINQFKAIEGDQAFEGAQRGVRMRALDLSLARRRRSVLERLARWQPRVEAGVHAMPEMML